MSSGLARTKILSFAEAAPWYLDAKEYGILNVLALGDAMLSWGWCESWIGWLKAGAAMRCLDGRWLANSAAMGAENI